MQWLTQDLLWIDAIMYHQVSLVQSREYLKHGHTHRGALLRDLSRISDEGAADWHTHRVVYLLEEHTHKHTHKHFKP